MPFPQTEFVAAIANVINQLPVAPRELVDMPCGSGFTTILLAEKFPATQFMGIDIEPRFLGMRLRNVQFFQSDIHDFIEKKEAFEVACIVNSLYLLPRPTELLEKLFSKIKPNGTLILIVPNIESGNFRAFQKRQPGVNGFVPSASELTALLKAIGFKILRVQPIVFTKIYGRWDTKLLFPFRDAYLNFLEKRNAKKGDKVGSYELYLLRK